MSLRRKAWPWRHGEFWCFTMKHKIARTERNVGQSPPNFTGMSPTLNRFIWPLPEWLERHLVGALTAPLRLSPSTKKNSEPLWCFSVKTVRFHWTAHRGCHVNHHEIGHRFWRTWKALKLMNLGTDLQCDEGFHVLWSLSNLAALCKKWRRKN